MLNKLALMGARFMPTALKTFIHHHQFLDRFSRRVYGGMMGSHTVDIEEGPMKGLKLVTGPNVSHAHVRGIYEQETMTAIDGQVRPGFICYDLGASIGYVTLLMARKARHVYAFEPAPHAAAEMRRQLAANEMNNVSIVLDPVSHNEREVSFALTDAACGSAINETETRWEILKLRTTTLDRFAERNPPPDFIKIDVEGEEGPVLEGSRGLLRTKRPVICCELHSVEAARHVCRVLEESGYRVRQLNGEPFVVPDEIVAGDVQVMAMPA